MRKFILVCLSLGGRTISCEKKYLEIISGKPIGGDSFAKLGDQLYKIHENEYGDKSILIHFSFDELFEIGKTKEEER